MKAKIEEVKRMEEKLKLLNQMLESNEFYPDDGKCFYDLFPECYKVHYYSSGNREKGTIECGSIRLSDTPKALYRIMFLLKPKIVDFSDMYKPTLVEIVSPDYDFVASFCFYKYTAALYFSCVPEFLGGQENTIICGMPGKDNGTFCTSGTGKLWFDVLKASIERKHEVYPGNKFEV